MLRANRIRRNETNAQRENRLARNRQYSEARRAREIPAQREDRLARLRQNAGVRIANEEPPLSSNLTLTRPKLRY